MSSDSISHCSHCQRANGLIERPNQYDTDEDLRNDAIRSVAMSGINQTQTTRGSYFTGRELKEIKKLALLGAIAGMTAGVTVSNSLIEITNQVGFSVLSAPVVGTIVGLTMGVSLGILDSYVHLSDYLGQE